jgi:serine/threonine-protein kinase RsbW
MQPDAGYLPGQHMSASSVSCRLTCRNDLSELLNVNAGIQAFVDKNQIPAKAAYALDLTIEELVSNIIKYGYDDKAEHTIRIEVDLQGQQVILTIEDDGHAFNPVKQAAPDTAQSLAERPIGGLGLHMVREMAEQMEYRREGNRNIVVVRIRRA